MPVIFAELASQYPPSEVSDLNSPAAAANGQYILITREAYDAVGGHAAIAGSLLEDVELARRVKQSGRKIFFRFGGDAVCTRMYRSFPQLKEGWTKNLALLFPAPGRRALWRFLEFLALLLSLILFVLCISFHEFLFAPLFLIGPGVTMQRIARAHFPWSANLLVLFGLPLFSYLLLRSKLFHQKGVVTWKGRAYGAAVNDHATVPDHSSTIARKLS